MMDEITFIGNNNPEDVRWLCSLTDSELDLLISLKKLALQRAKSVGHESLAQKFDLKMLRALGYILMQLTTTQVNDLQLTGLSKLDDFFDGCNLLKLDLEDRIEKGEQAKTEEKVNIEEQAKTTEQEDIGESATRSSNVADTLKRKRNEVKIESELSN